MINHTILSFLKNNELGLVFLASSILCGVLQAYPSFPDPDSFYHARIAAEMIRGPILTFPNLPFTALSDIFIDHHFLYHILLIPFVTFIDPLIGIKIATTIFAAGFLTFFYWLLRRYAHASRPIALTFLVLLILNTVFLFRLNLAKIPAVSLIFFFAGILAMIRGRTGFVFGLSFLYVWLYGGWPLLPFSSLIFLLINWCVKRGMIFSKGDDVPFERFDEGSLKRKGYTAAISVPLASFSGALTGLIINPSFPTNISFYWLQTFKIAVLNTLSNIPVGNEWYPSGTSFIPAHGPTLILLVFSLCAFAFPGLFASVFHTPLPRRTPPQWFLGLLSIIFFFLTLKSRRYGEYFAPLATLFSAWVLTPLLSRELFSRFLGFTKNILRHPRTAAGTIAIYFLITGPLIITISFVHVITSYWDGLTITRYANGIRWLKDTLPPNATIFHNRWDDFPLLYYHAPSFRYISGLDPRFLYEKNPEQAKQYNLFSQGDDLTETFGYRALCTAISSSQIPIPLACSPLLEKIRTAEFISSFHPQAIVLTYPDLPLDKKIRQHPGFSETYRDSEMTIFLTAARQQWQE